jgi:outer membrane biosynthesis protein TonB
MKLIFNGKVLENNLTLDTQGINETNFLVIVGKKLGAPTNARKKKKMEEEKKPEEKKPEEIKPVEKKEEKKPVEEKKEEKKMETT